MPPAPLCFTVAFATGSLLILLQILLTTHGPPKIYVQTIFRNFFSPPMSMSFYVFTFRLYLFYFLACLFFSLLFLSLSLYLFSCFSICVSCLSLFSLLVSLSVFLFSLLVSLSVFLSSSLVCLSVFLSSLFYFIPLSFLLSL